MEETVLGIQQAPIKRNKSESAKVYGLKVLFDQETRAFKYYKLNIMN